MKLLLTNFHDGDGGGHTTYLLALASRLAAAHEVHVAAPASSRLLQEAQRLPGVHAHVQSFPNGLGALSELRQARARLHALIARTGVEVVHVNGSADHRLVLSSIGGLAHRPRVVLTKHNSKAMTGLGHWWRARRTDAVIAVSGHTLAMLQASPYARLPLHLVRNGIDTNVFAPWPTELLDDARNAAFGEVELLLGSCAGTAAHKGWMDLARAIALLPEADRARIGVLLCGKPPSAAQRDELAALGVAKRFRFVGPLDDVKPAIAGVDAGFVLSHAVETISFACREMMAMGKPVMVTRYAGLPENIIDGEDGWVVPVNDPESIRQVLAGMLADRAQLKGMGLRARAHAERAFGIDGFVNATAAVYAAPQAIRATA